MTLRKCMVFGASALLVAGQAAAQSGIPITKDRVSTTTTTTLTSPGDVSAPVASSLTVTEVNLPAFYTTELNERNILAFMFGGDSLEIEMGRLAQTKGTDQRVRDYGSMLVNDHTAHLGTLEGIRRDEGLEPLPFANNVEASRMRGMLVWLGNTPASPSWDAAFVRFQAAHHQNAIDLVNLNIKNAHDDDFEKVIDATLQSFANHRDRARTIATELGVSLP
jgi:predicted outer membrane protein